MEFSDRYAASLTDDGRYRLLVEAVTDYAIYMLDPSGIITSWNPGAQRFKGYAANEIIGQHFSRFYPEADRKNRLPERALETARREGKFESEGWRVRKDGTQFWAFVVIDPIRAPDGSVATALTAPPAPPTGSTAVPAPGRASRSCRAGTACRGCRR